MLPNITKSQFLLYGDKGYDSHVVRYLLAEKQLDCKFCYLPYVRPDMLAQLNPYKTLPILVNHDVCLYKFYAIFEYLEERHKAITLLPMAPNARAKVRQLMWRIQNDWLSLAHILLRTRMGMDDKTYIDTQKKLTDMLITLSPLFKNTFFLGDTLSICDVLLLPMLHRLDAMGIILPKRLCPEIIDYYARLSTRAEFSATLTYPAALEFENE